MIDSAREHNRRAFFALVSRHLKGSITSFATNFAISRPLVTWRPAP